MQNDPVRIFIVDDDEVYLQAMQFFLLNDKSGTVSIHPFSTGEGCLEKLHLNPSIVVLDYYLNSAEPDAENGINILKKIREYSPDIKVIILSAQDDVNIAVRSLENGAFDYISKSESAFVKIKNIVANVKKHHAATNTLKKEISIHKKINILVVLILILLFILSRIF